MEHATGGLSFPDPFVHGRGPLATFAHAILATALFRCWHILIFFAAWSTIISVISHTTKNLGISSTLLTVFVGSLSLRSMDFDAFSLPPAASVPFSVLSFLTELRPASKDTTRVGGIGRKSSFPHGPWQG
jgi:hypothetical protein